MPALLVPQPAVGDALAPNSARASVVAQETCSDDVGIQYWGLGDPANGGFLKDPPDYAAGDVIEMYYDLYNNSCTDLSIMVELRGSVSDALIQNGDPNPDQYACLSGCAIPSSSRNQFIRVIWDLGKHPNADEEHVVASITVTAPGDFVDEDTSNNTATSAQFINIVNDPPVEPPDTPTPTLEPTDTPTPEPTDTPTPEPTLTPEPTETPTPESTPTPEPTETPTPEPTPAPTNTPRPTATPTPTPLPNVELSVSTTAPGTGVAGDTIIISATLSGEWEGVDDLEVRLCIGSPDCAEPAAKAQPEEGGTVNLEWDTTGQASGLHSLHLSALIPGSSGENGPTILARAQHTLILAPSDGAVFVLMGSEDGNGGKVVGAMSAPQPMIDTPATYPTATPTPTPTATPEPTPLPEVNLTVGSAAPKVGIVGDTITIPATLGGEWEGVDGLEVRLCIGSPDCEQPAAQGQPDANGTLNLRWDTTGQASGPHSLHLSALIQGDSGETGPEILARVQHTIILAPAAHTIFVLMGPDVGNGGKVVGEVSAPQPMIDTPGTYPTATPTPTPGPRHQIEMTLDPDSPALWVIGVPVTIRANVTNAGETDGSIEVQLHYASGGEFEMVAELTDVSISAKSNKTLELMWDTKNYERGPHRLWVSVLSTNGDEPLDTAEFHVVLQPAGAIYALIPENKQTYGKIVGEVSAPQPVFYTRAIYPTPTPTPTPTAAPRIDAEIIGISSVPSGKAVQGEWVEIRVEVRNNGDKTASIPVQLTFPSADKNPEIERLEVEPNGSGVETFVWKTRNYEVGYHTLRADLLLGDNTTSGATSRAITLVLVEQVVTALIESVEASSESAVVGEPVTIAVAVRNTSLLAANIPVTLHFPSNDRQPETRKPRAEPGATVVETFTWRTSRYEPGEHVFRVEAPGSEWTFAVPLAAPMSDFNVVETYAPDPDMPSVRGDWVEVSALVSNAGPQAGRATVSLSDAARGETMYRENLDLDAHEMRTVHFTWKTLRYEPGIYNLQVAAEGANDTNRDNDVAEVGPITVLDDGNISVGYGGDHLELQLRQQLSEPVLPAKPNFSIGVISWEPKAPAVGDVVSVTVEVRNDGSRPGRVPVTLHFPSDEKQPQTREPRARPGETSVATFTWRTGRYEPGAHVFRVAVPGDERSFTVALVAPAPVVDAEIVGIVSNPVGVAMQGEQVEIAVTVLNKGSHAMRIPVWLTFPSASKQPERESPMVQPGQSDVATFTWKTSNYEPGDYTLTADLLADGNTTTGDTSATIELRLTPPVIAATIADISVFPASAVVGERVTVAVSVRNDSPIPANIPVTLHFPPTDKQPETRNPRAAPGETVVASFDWRTGRYEPGDHVFSVAVPGDEWSFTASLVAPVPAVPPGGGAVGPAVVAPPAAAPASFAIAGISWSPAAPVAGEPVSITVEISNEGAQAGSAPVTLYFPSADKDPETFRPRAAPGETVIRKFTWLTGRYAPGTHRFRVETSSDRKVFFIELLPPTVDFVVGEIYPPNPSHPIVKGDWTEVAALVSNIGRYEGRARVSLRDLTEGRVMYDQNVALGPDESRVVEFTWKTLRYDVGGHWLRVEAEAKYDADTSNNYSEQAWAEILTNRDITLGFGGGNPEPEQGMIVEASKPRIKSAPEVPAGIAVLNDAPSAIMERGFKPLQEMLSVDPLLQSGSLSGLAADLGAQDYRMSPYLCAQRQQPTGWLQEHGKQCPGVWALVR